MDYKLFSVRDAAGAMYAPIFAFETEELAKRAVADTIIKGDSMIAMHPEDFALYHLGYFNNVTGVIRPVEVPELVVQCSSISQAILKKVQQNKDKEQAEVLQFAE